MKALAIAVFVFVAFFSVAVQATSITINNYSFESAPTNTGSTPTILGLNGYSDNSWSVPVPDWTFTYAGSVGNTNYGELYPSSGQFHTSPVVPNGNQALYLFAVNTASVSASQTLSAAPLTAGDTYTLNFDVGVETGFAFEGSSGNYTVELLAGSNVLATFTGSPGGTGDPCSATDTNCGAWGDYSLSYTATGASPGLGQDLVIQISDNNGNEIAFDDLALDASPSSSVPEPSSMLYLALTLLGLMGTGGAWWRVKRAG